MKKKFTMNKKCALYDAGRFRDFLIIQKPTQVQRGHRHNRNP